MTFKQLFPDWESFKQFLIDYGVYYSSDLYTDAKVLVYWSLLYRNYANSHIAYDVEVFYDQLSLTVEEHFREFFMIREMLDFLADSSVEDRLTGMTAITNMAENPNIETNADTIVDYIGLQTRQKTTENIVDRVNSLVKKIRVPEIRNEHTYYRDLFLRIIPRADHLFPTEGYE